jgi:tetratricopeptide (TPR) repeat protein
MRHESALRQAGDFQKAVDLWSQALAKDPNQYIWRRRIQQYGSRLDKPYPFYDWMEKAEKDIKARGEEPVALQILPSKSEIAQPIKKPLAALKKAVSPDPDGRIHRDTSGLIEAEVTAVPSSIDPGGSARIHVVFRPNVSLEAHWNNEAEPLRLWMELPEGWVIDSRLLVAPQPEETESAELRRFDFDIQSPMNVASGRVRISAYALYYACEGIKGTCQFLRQDIDIEIDVKR